jgi:transcriptional regulator with XRE-family HTH domain
MIALEVPMEHCTKGQLEYVLNYIKQVSQSRHLKQTVLEQDSGVPQPTISRLFGGQLDPTLDLLRKLCMGLGTNIEEVLHTPERSVPYLLGYVATPLTGLSDAEDRELRRLVLQLKAMAGPDAFPDPRIELHWPGDFTHPKLNPEHTAQQVYRKDRASASTCNFLVMLCLSSSYGVGQENEIAAQAGNPAIRFLPPTVSRMLGGSLLHAIDIKFTGSLSKGIDFDPEDFIHALTWIQQTYFLQQPMYGHLNGNEFGDRLAHLLAKRVSNRQEFAAKLGVAEHYLEVLLHESFVVSNPSARLLKRLGRLLCVSVGYLLGESKEADPVWIDSHASWRSWIRTPGIEAGPALEVMDDWEADYIMKASQCEPGYASHRNDLTVRTKKDWDIEYQKLLKRKGTSNDGQPTLF